MGDSYDFEWTPVTQIVPGDTIYRWSDELLVLCTEHNSHIVKITVRETDGSDRVFYYKDYDKLRVPTRWTQEQRLILEKAATKAAASVLLLNLTNKDE